MRPVIGFGSALAIRNRNHTGVGAIKITPDESSDRPDVVEEYDRLSPAYDLRRKLVALRQRAGLTQEEAADRLNTKKSNISRLESVNSSISPKLSTIVAYAFEFHLQGMKEDGRPIPKPSSAVEYVEVTALQTV